MTSAGLYRRVVRRETHSSRSRLAIVLAALLVLLLVWVGVESVLAALGQKALLVAPGDGASAVLGAVAAPAAVFVAGGAVLVLVGLALVVTALAPGRRGRRGAGIDRTAAVIDDRVIAQSLAQTAAYAGDVEPDDVEVSVGGRRVDVRVQRASGREADVRSIQEAVDDALASYDYDPRLRARVRLSEKGTVAR